MRPTLDSTATQWQALAREFTDQQLIPWEVEAEHNGGNIPADVKKRHEVQARELGFSAMDVPASYGGREARIVDQVAVWEQLGRATNALSWCFSEPQRWMFEACSEQQIQSYVLPLMHGTRKECYAITESGSGSDVAGIESTAAKDGDHYRINGEKWYVTSANHADFMFVQAKFAGGSHRDEHGLFLVDMDSDGLELVRTPLFSHTFAAHHPIYRLNEVCVPVTHLIGAEGDGMEYAHSWFRRERLMIAARCCGAAARLIEEATDFAQNRMVGGRPLSDRQLIQAMLADSAIDLWTSQLVTYEAAAAHDRGDDVKTLHVRCSIAKLHASEAAYRIADRAAQIFGGRGYMRENVAERFSRELRVDRIWEGTSEIQRLIIAKALLKRGLEDL